MDIDAQEISIRKDANDFAVPSPPQITVAGVGRVVGDQELLPSALSLVPDTSPSMRIKSSRPTPYDLS
jgi:hypothetical protein